MSEFGSGGARADGKALVNASDVAVSKDGKHVYVMSLNSGVAVFVRQKKK